MIYGDVLKLINTQENKVSVKELKKIMKLCGPKQSKYAGNAVDWFQEKRYDFNEELNSIFVKLCIDDDQLNIATKRLLYKKGRIGAWTTTSSLNRLLNALLEKGEVSTMVDLLDTLAPKGVRMNSASFEACLDASCRGQNRSAYERTVAISGKYLSDDDLSALTEKYPIPDEVKEEEVSEEVESAEEVDEKEDAV